ncbi:uncharacterized protein C8Q71DRAFT_739006 [Rhodofomes roseus]|uniref:Ser-Thr-rich glycosyl-phosphatidyl-inositol-anchored membrane family-domain-containing protein n=1 Tax=Rhodofomes roseus TaxID=34475 RepID=A0ABQ8KSY6_9APHY|nr:uncharacterized protein C8Q71DRAFT_739006 [Rhodofomes roseus]KAH9841832.1 hypothetical protein C8Q71DRAFT_739006 [Rhodofomes roseus]
MLAAMIYALFFLLAAVHAVPLRRDVHERDVISPPITSPDASTVWNVGETVTVTWNLSALPPDVNVTGAIGKVVLGYSTWDSENLMIDSPLAQSFLLSAGQVSFTVPSVPTRTNYIVDLFGDSGNISPNFTIIGTSDSSSATSTAATSTSVAVSETTSESVSVIVTTELSTAVTTMPSNTGTASSAYTPSTAASVETSASGFPASSAASVPTASAASSVAAPTSSSSSISAASDNSDTSGAMSLMGSSFFHPSLAAVIATLSFIML